MFIKKVQEKCSLKKFAKQVKKCSLKKLKNVH